jgi:BlaI family penicillinase repressor
MQATPSLSRRERQIMDLIYERGKSSAREIQEALTDAPSYSTVRALLAILVEKNHLKYEQAGAKYLYFAAQPIDKVRENAARRLIKTFFKGSTADAVNALIGTTEKPLSDADLDELALLIEQARKKKGDGQ